MGPVASAKSGYNGWLEHEGGEHDVSNELPKGPVPGPQGRVRQLEAASWNYEQSIEYSTPGTEVSCCEGKNVLYSD